jgi:hypothetical protein
MAAPLARSHMDDRIALGPCLRLCPPALAVGPASQRERGNEHRNQDDPPDHDPPTSPWMMREHLSISRIIELPACRGRAETRGRRKDFVQIKR